MPSSPSRTESDVTAAEVAAARPAVEELARRTPMLSSRTLSERAGGVVALKAENLQRTGSFKVRGVAAKLASLGEEGCRNGVVAASAGNHAQALAAAARQRGVPCEVFVPSDAPLAKVEAARGQGATIHVGGELGRRVPRRPRSRAPRRAGWRSCTRSTTRSSSPARARSGSSCSRTCPTSPRSSCRSAAAGCAPAWRSPSRPRGPRSRSSACRSRPARPTPSRCGAASPSRPRSALTIADGIAVKRPGELTLRLLDRWADDVVVVGEDETAEAMVVLMERAKLVVEGAGAVGVAALLGGQVQAAASGTTVAILSGGNVDAGLLASIARRHETEAGRRLVLFTRLPDRPGNLARLLDCVAHEGANIVDVSHVREGVDLHVRETAVELVIETRGQQHADAVVAALKSAGYDARIVR